MKYTQLQIAAIQNKSRYADSYYCKVTADDVKQFLEQNNVSIGRAKQKDTLLSKIWDNAALTELFITQFYDQYGCSIYDLIESYGLSFEDAQALINTGAFKVIGENKKGYPVISMDCLSYTKQEITDLIKDKLGGSVIKIRLDVANKQEGDAAIERLSMVYDVSEVRQYDRRDGRLHIYTTLMSKTN